eukprot:486504-Amphidinium_carterae.1
MISCSSAYRCTPTSCLQMYANESLEVVSVSIGHQLSAQCGRKVLVSFLGMHAKPLSRVCVVVS